MASKAISGVGTKFRRWNTDLQIWENISEINSITGPSKTRETIDVTSLDSTGGYKEFIASFRDAGQVSLKMNFTRRTYELMNDDYESDTVQNYEIVLNDVEKTTLEFEGLVTEVPLDIPLGDKVTADVVIKVTGRVIINSGASTGL